MTEEQILDYIHEWFSQHPNVLVLKQQLKTNNMNSTIKLLNETISHKKESIKILEKQKDALIRNITRFQQSIDEGNNEIRLLESDLKKIHSEPINGGVGCATSANPNRIRDIFSNEPV